jgi:DNA-binding XRE family transcriptional regulator
MGTPNRVALARAEAGLTQLQLAEAVGASLRTINRIEKGQRPRLTLAVRLARTLGVELTELFDDEDAA